MEDADEEICEAEKQCVVSEGARHGQGDSEHRPHRTEHHEPNAAFIDIGRARQPGVCIPRPPDGCENEHSVEDSSPRGVVRQQACDLSDGEHEHEVEEEFERRYLVLVAVLRLALCLRHASPFIPFSIRQIGSS
jgi:hypothetical protein